MSGPTTWIARSMASLALALGLLWLAGPAAADAESPSASEPAARNVIVMIPDGMGPAYLTLARLFTDEQRLALDAHHVGAAITHAEDRLVTDSAAGATAIASGVRTNYLHVGMDADDEPVATLLEAAADQRDMATGIVVTCRITHATPACFAAHVTHRWEELSIAAQMLENRVDLLLGGGWAWFVPEDDDSGHGRRDDGRDLLEEAEDAGYTLLRTRADFDASFDLPALGLFARDHLAYEIDRDPDREPSLTAMTRRAIELLADEPDGFFLMVEGARIDHAGHANDAAAALHDVLEYDRAFAEAIEFARADGQTLVVSVADHDTGGLALHQGRWESRADDEDTWFLNRVTGSLDAIVDRLEADGEPAEVLAEMAGLVDISDDEIAAVNDALERGRRAARRTIAPMINSRANLAWTTTSHTGVDVTVHAFGPGAERFQGIQPLANVGQHIAELIAVDLEAQSRVLREALTTAEGADSGN